MKYIPGRLLLEGEDLILNFVYMIVINCVHGGCKVKDLLSEIERIPQTTQAERMATS